MSRASGETGQASGSAAKAASGRSWLIHVCGCGARYVGLPGEPTDNLGDCALCQRPLKDPIETVEVAERERSRRLEEALERIRADVAVAGYWSTAYDRVLRIARAALTQDGGTG